MDEWVILWVWRGSGAYSLLFRGRSGSRVGVSGSIHRCRLESSPTPINPSSPWYNPLNNNDKPAQEDEES